MNMLEFLEKAAAKDAVTKEEFGVLVHSDDQEEVERALEALEEAGGYDNLDD